jgi:hypothetical protein
LADAYRRKTMDYKYASEHFYTDVKAYEIVKVISDKTVEVRRLEATYDISHLEQVVGGFAGHVVNQRDQKVTFESAPNAPVIRIRKNKYGNWAHKGRRFTFENKPYAFYDYNF